MLGWAAIVCSLNVAFARPTGVTSIALQRARTAAPGVSSASRRLLRNVMMELKVNGQSHAVDADPDTPLLYVLREDLKLNAAKFGCGLAQCGACTVIVNG